MRNTFVIAGKEFSDLVRSNVMVVVLAVYCMLLLYEYYDSYSVINNNLLQFGVVGPVDDPAISPGSLVSVLCGYGGLVAVVLGLSSMYYEVSNRAINTLMVKPVYRDVILNGKLLGAVFFAFCLFVFTVLVNISLNFVFWGEHFSRAFPAFLGRLPVVLVSYMQVFMMFYLLTVLMFLLFRRSSLAFFLAFIAWIFLYEVVPSGFSPSLASFFPNSEQMGWVISTLSPKGMLSLIFDRAADGMGAFSANILEFFKMMLYVGVLLVSCYIVFLRRDVS